jgi:hypothetical protein
MAKSFRLYIVLLIFSTTAFFSCKTDFPVNAPYKEVNVVYGLLELHNPVQIIKISKIYQNGNGVTAYQAAQQIDSLYQKDSLKVSLTDNNTGIQTALIKYLDNHKEPGTFAYPIQYLYKTPAGFSLLASHAYLLSIYNPKTNVTSTASTFIVGDVVSDRPNSTSPINFPNTGSGAYPIAFIPGPNTASYDLNLKISVREYKKSDSSLIRTDTLEWTILKNYNVTPGTQVFYSILGRDFYNYLAATLTVDKNVYRKLDSLDFDFIGAGQELTNYISVNKPSIGIVQKKPDYTNLSNGAGIFSSRLHDHVLTQLSDPSFDVLISSDATRALNFIK